MQTRAGLSAVRKLYILKDFRKKKVHVAVFPHFAANIFNINFQFRVHSVSLPVHIFPSRFLCHTFTTQVIAAFPAFHSVNKLSLAFDNV